LEATGNDRASPASRSRYTAEAQARCEATEAKLGIVRARIRVAAAAGNHGLNRQLLNLEHQAEMHLAKVRHGLERLRGADDESWRTRKQDLEDRWEDLSRSLNNLVARL